MRIPMCISDCPAWSVMRASCTFPEAALCWIPASGRKSAEGELALAAEAPVEEFPTGWGAMAAGAVTALPEGPVAGLAEFVAVAAGVAPGSGPFGAGATFAV